MEILQPQEKGALVNDLNSILLEGMVVDFKVTRPNEKEIVELSLKSRKTYKDDEGELRDFFTTAQIVLKSHLSSTFLYRQTGVGSQLRIVGSLSQRYDELLQANVLFVTAEHIETKKFVPMEDAKTEIAAEVAKGATE